MYNLGCYVVRKIVVDLFIGIYMLFFDVDDVIEFYLLELFDFVFKKYDVDMIRYGLLVISGID